MSAGELAKAAVWPAGEEPKNVGKGDRLEWAATPVPGGESGRWQVSIPGVCPGCPAPARPRFYA